MGCTGPADMDLERGSASSVQHWTDIDDMDRDDPMACTEYVHDIVRHLLEAEVRCHKDIMQLPCNEHSSLLQAPDVAEEEASLSELHGDSSAGYQHQHAWHSGGLVG